MMHPCPWTPVVVHVPTQLPPTWTGWGGGGAVGPLGHHPG